MRYKEVVFSCLIGAGPMQEIGMRAKCVYLEHVENARVRSAKELAKGVKSSRIQHTGILANGLKLYALCQPVLRTTQWRKYDGFCRDFIVRLNGL